VFAFHSPQNILTHIVEKGVEVEKGVVTVGLVAQKAPAFVAHRKSRELHGEGITTGTTFEGALSGRPAAATAVTK
jgi:hypothetical protein